MGSPEFAVPVLRQLSELVEIVGVVTQPDRPAGRGKIISPPQVKVAAEQLGLQVIQPAKLKEPFAREQLINWQPDLIVVAAFGQILRPWALELPKFGCINVHGSLLPRWRGASPIQAAILNGDAETGISIMKMDAGIDTGDVLSKVKVEIASDDTTESLSEKLASAGARLLIETLPGYISGEICPKPQGEKGASYAGMISPDDAILDFQLSARELERKVRAYQPWPIAKMMQNDLPLAIYQAESVICEGTVVGEKYIHQKNPAVGTSDGYLVLKVIQPAGKKRMSGRDFLNGNKSWEDK